MPEKTKEFMSDIVQNHHNIGTLLLDACKSAHLRIERETVTASEHKIMQMHGGKFSDAKLDSGTAERIAFFACEGNQTHDIRIDRRIGSKLNLARENAYMLLLLLLVLFTDEGRVILFIDGESEE
ncbi:hypothetical protein Trydic_g11636 [Trypoxylus dichotomus]